MNTFEIIIEKMTDEQLNVAYSQNQNARRNEMTCIIEKQASIDLEILYDREIRKRATKLMAITLNNSIAGL